MTNQKNKGKGNSGFLFGMTDRKSKGKDNSGFPWGMTAEKQKQILQGDKRCVWQRKADTSLLFDSYWAGMILAVEWKRW